MDMTIAEIHGKISHIGSNLSDRLEDLLTSDLFGPMRYLPFEIGLKPILESAINASTGEHLLIENHDTSGHFKVSFWPQLTYSEPDVVIECCGNLIFVEAKYLSGKSGHFTMEDEGSDNVQAAGSDQLYREYMDLISYPGSFQSRTLIYLTAHRILPADDIRAGKDALSVRHQDIPLQEYDSNFYWLSWYAVRDKVSQMLELPTHEKFHLILYDISLLLNRKGFRRFDGFPKIKVGDVSVRNTSKVFYKRVYREHFLFTQNDVIPSIKPILYEIIKTRQYVWKHTSTLPSLFENIVFYTRGI